MLGPHFKLVKKSQGLVAVPGFSSDLGQHAARRGQNLLAPARFASVPKVLIDAYCTSEIGPDPAKTLNLVHEARHDFTLKLWLEACFDSWIVWGSCPLSVQPQVDKAISNVLSVGAAFTALYVCTIASGLAGRKNKELGGLSRRGLFAA
jgi:hypothetical protein